MKPPCAAMPGALATIAARQGRSLIGRRGTRMGIDTHTRLAHERWFTRAAHGASVHDQRVYTVVTRVPAGTSGDGTSEDRIGMHVPSLSCPFRAFVHALAGCNGRPNSAS